LLGACVPSVPHFVTAAESRAGRPYPDAEYGSAAELLEPEPPAPAAAAPSAGRAVPTRGYWHWDGLDYVWIEGGYEPEAPAYLWSWRAGRR